mmetsp:Transcript_93873/g.137087  ORF Transcript_93873/g.137087 Transcript_93873/m.137087 type:complete len:224 (-) Transcript_93873:1156-1827(-)
MKKQTCHQVLIGIWIIKPFSHRRRYRYIQSHANHPQLTPPMILEDKLKSLTTITNRERRQHLYKYILHIALPSVGTLLHLCLFLHSRQHCRCVLLLGNDVEPLTHLGIKGGIRASRDNRQSIRSIAVYSNILIKVFLDVVPDTRILLGKIAGDILMKAIESIGASLIHVLVELFVVARVFKQHVRLRCHGCFWRYRHTPDTLHFLNNPSDSFEWPSSDSFALT